MKYALIATGGTIATSGENTANNFDLPFSTEEVDFINYSEIVSSAINLDYLQQFSDFIKSKTTEYDGIVITHGTDTMEETAFYLESTIDTSTPIIITGSMRQKYHLGYEGLKNIHEALIVAKSSASYGLGVQVCFNGCIFPAEFVEKTESLNYNAFSSTNAGMSGRLLGNEVLYYYQPKRLPKYQNTPSGKIFTFSFQTAMNWPIYLEAMAKADCIVIEGVGSGRIPAIHLGDIRELCEKKTVYLCTRVQSGTVFDDYGYPGSYAYLKKEGFKLNFSHHSAAKTALIAALNHMYYLGSSKRYL